MGLLLKKEFAHKGTHYMDFFNEFTSIEIGVNENGKVASPERASINLKANSRASGKRGGGGGGGI